MDLSVDEAGHAVCAKTFGGMVMMGLQSAAAALPGPLTFLLAMVGIIGLSVLHRCRHR